MKETNKKPLCEISIELSQLEQEINLKITLYNRLIREVNERYPVKIFRDTFKEKELIDKGGEEHEYRRNKK